MSFSACLRIAVLSLTLGCSAVALSGCEHMPWYKQEKVKKPKPKKAKTVKKETQAPTAQSYVSALTLTRLSLMTGGDGEEHVETIQNFCARGLENTRVTLVMLEYKHKDSGRMRQVIAPVAQGNAQKAIGDIMERVALLGALHDIRIHSSEVLSGCVPPEDSAAWSSFVEDQLALITEQAVSLEATEEVKVQLGLIGYFIDRRFRDAAYLLVDNVKRTLAKLSQGEGGDDPTVRALSRQLETQEDRLRKEMPFTL